MKAYTDELSFAKNLAHSAGDIIVANFSKTTRTIKANATPVTETDLAVSRLVIDEVKKHFPAHEVLDEELQSEHSDATYLWVCDPVDGTIPFSHSIPTSVFSLALCEDGKPVVAVVYDPFMKRMLWTSKGSPAYCNTKEIHVNDKALTPGETVFTIPYWFGHQHPFDYTTFYEYFRDKKVIVSTVESLVYLSMLVASGAIVAAVMTAANPWDRAAALLTVVNAGGMCTDEQSRDITVFGTHRFFVASNGIVHDELLQILNRSIA